VQRSKSIRLVACSTSIALVMATIAPTIALAQGKPAAAKAGKAAAPKSLKDSLSGDAKAAYERGVTLFDAKNPEGARTEFEKAYQSSKDPRLLFNMAIAEREMKHYSRAVVLLNQELTEGASTVPEAEKKTAQEVLEALKAFTAPLTVNVNEPGATVIVDGQEVGKTPLSGPVTVDVGERQITVKKPGFLDGTAKVSISGGTPATTEVKLDPSVKNGKLTVKANGATEAVVFVDGVEAGPPPWTGEVKEGKHTVEIRARGFVTESRSETVEFKGTTVIEVTLRPEQGKVRVETDKPENAILIDGNKVGMGTWEGILPAGGHQLVVTRDGAQPFQSDLAVATDQTRTVKVSLQSKGGTPWWVWAGAGVLIVGGGVATYFLTKPKTEDPTPGTIEPRVAPVGLRF
jgi:hypothetical protein